MTDTLLAIARDRPPKRWNPLRAYICQWSNKCQHVARYDDATRCSQHRMWPRKRGRPVGETTRRLVELVKAGKLVNQNCAAKVLGISRQRVNQIIQREGLKLGREQQPNTLISWPCPGCGQEVKMWTAQRNRNRG